MARARNFIIVLKSNFDLVGGKGVGCCIAGESVKVYLLPVQYPWCPIAFYAIYISYNWPE